MCTRWKLESAKCLFFCVYSVGLYCKKANRCCRCHHRRHQPLSSSSTQYIVVCSAYKLKLQRERYSEIYYTQWVGVYNIINAASLSNEMKEYERERIWVDCIYMLTLLLLSIQTEIFTAYKHDPICFSYTLQFFFVVAFYHTSLSNCVCIFSVVEQNNPFSHMHWPFPVYFSLDAFNCITFS